MKKYIRKILQPFLAVYRRRKSKVVLDALAVHGEVKVRQVAGALQDAMFSGADTDSSSLLTRIELRRQELLARGDEIAVIDYGAGSPTSGRTREQMESGVRSYIKVSQACSASKPAPAATLLFHLIRNLRPASCVELGTCVGISAAYQATALRRNGAGRLMTLEGAPEVARIARETMSKMELGNVEVVEGPFHKTLMEVFERAKPIDYFFNDGHHDRDAVLNYFEAVMPCLSDEAVIVFDDISWSDGMRTAWKKIEDDPRVCVSFDLGSMGIAFLKKEGGLKERYKVPF